MTAGGHRPLQPSGLGAAHGPDALLHCRQATLHTLAAVLREVRRVGPPPTWGLTASEAEALSDAMAVLAWEGYSPTLLRMAMLYIEPPAVPGLAPWNRILRAAAEHVGVLTGVTTPTRYNGPPLTSTTPAPLTPTEDTPDPERTPVIPAPPTATLEARRQARAEARAVLDQMFEGTLEEALNDPPLLNLWMLLLRHLPQAHAAPQATPSALFRHWRHLWSTPADDLAEEGSLLGVGLLDEASELRSEAVALVALAIFERTETDPEEEA